MWIDVPFEMSARPEEYIDDGQPGQQHCAASSVAKSTT